MKRNESKPLEPRRRCKQKKRESWSRTRGKFHKLGQYGSPRLLDPDRISYRLMMKSLKCHDDSHCNVSRNVWMITMVNLIKDKKHMTGPRKHIKSTWSSAQDILFIA